MGIVQQRDAGVNVTHYRLTDQEFDGFLLHVLVYVNCLRFGVNLLILLKIDVLTTS